MMTKLAELPVVHAANYYPTRSAPIRAIGIHVPVTAETNTAAEGVARYFAEGGTYSNGWRRTASGAVIGSTHLVVDNDSAIRCAHDHETAFGAAGMNSDGLHVELAGTIQTPGEWADEYSTAVIERAAPLCAEWCVLHDIPPVRLTDAQLAAGGRGFVGHDQVSRVYRKSTHTDPGVAFPWDLFLSLVKVALVESTPVPTLPEGNEMLTLISVEGDPGPVYLTDLLRYRRHLTAAELAAAVAGGVVKDGTVHPIGRDQVVALKLVGKQYPKTHD